MGEGQKPSYDSVTEEMLDRASRKALGVINIKDSDAHDADTVYGDTSRGERTGVRFMGIDALEADQGKEGAAGAQWMKEQAAAAGGEFGAEGGAVDRRGRRVQMLYTKDGKPLNVEAVRLGHAIVYRDYLENVSPQMQDMLIAAENEAKEAKRGYWGNPDLERPDKFRMRKRIEAWKAGKKDEGDPFKPVGEEVYHEPDTALAQGLEPFDRPRNALASGVYGALKAPMGHKLETAARYFGQGLTGHRATTGTMLKDAATGELGLGKVRAGYDDGEFQIGDILDHAIDFGIDIGTDPLMALGRAITALRGAGRLAKIAPELDKGLRELDAVKAGIDGAKMTPEAEKAQKLIDRTRVGMGAAIGAGTQGGEDSGDDAAMGAVLGAGAAALGIHGSRKFGPKLRDKFDDLYDGYAKWSGKVGTVDEDIKKIVREAKADDGRPLLKRIREEVDGELNPNGDYFKHKDPAVLRERQLAFNQAVDERKAAEMAKVDDALRTEAKKQLEYSGKKFATAEEYEKAVVDKAKLISDVVVADGSISKAMRSAREGLHKIRYIASELTQHRYGILDKLNEGERGFFKDMMREGKEETKRFREEIYKSRDFDPDQMTGQALRERIIKGELTDWEKDALMEDFQKDFARQREELHTQITQSRDPREVNDLQKKMNDMVWRQVSFERELNQGFVHPFSTKKAHTFLSQRAEKTINEVTMMANAKADAYMAKKLPQVATENVREAVNSWVESNKKFMDRYNADVLGYTEGLSDEEKLAGKGVVGLNWHVEDVYSNKDLLEADNLFSAVRDSNLKAARAEGSSHTGLEIGEDNQYAVYAKGMAYKFIDKQTKEAMRMVRGYHEMLAKQGHVRGFEKILGVFDKMQNFAKANMLYFSTSWMKNNYFDNLAKAWIEGGYGNLRDVAATGKGLSRKLRNDLAHDLADIAAGKASRKLHDPEIGEAMRLGVIDALAFDTLLNHDELRMALKDTKSYKQFIAGAPEDPKGFLTEFADWWTGNLSKTVGAMGNYIESSARMVTYKNVKQQLMAVGHGEAAAKEIAADMVKKTFFDYGDVTAFEQAVFKRIIPFYGFYSKNLPYWAQAVTSPVKAGRIAGIEHVRQNIGEDLRPGEADGLQPYVRENNPRRLGKDKMGNIVFAITPAGSMDDAIKMMIPSTWKDVAVEKMSPLLKLPVELATRHDTFNDSPLLPSDNPKGKKFLYSRGFKLVAMQKLLEKAGMKPDSLGIHVDEKGNPYATDDAVAVADKILSTLYPHGAVDQIAGSLGKVGHEKETALQAIINRFSPIQQTKVTPQSMRSTKLKKEKERGR